FPYVSLPYGDMQEAALQPDDAIDMGREGQENEAAQAGEETCYREELTPLEMLLSPSTETSNDGNPIDEKEA
ncbi:hypothetical protein FRX31_004626, partial [Thalictrum thalictroides]